MKNFFKKLAFVLSLALVVSTIAPAAKASAAVAPKLNATSKVLYIGKDVTGGYSDAFTLAVKNKGTNKVSFTSSDKGIATVSSKGIVKAVSVGTATVTATVKSAKTGKVVKKLTAKFWVKKNAKEVGFSAASVASASSLKIGDTAKLNVYRADAAGNKVWKQADKTKITDYIVWSSSNPSVATVSQYGTVKAIASGTAVISAVAVQAQGKKETTKAATATITVKAKGITGVKQTTLKKIEVTFGTAQDTTKVTKDSFVVAPAAASTAIPVVKSVSWNTEKTVATVEFYIALTDKAAYTVSIKDAESKCDFVASVGSVAKVVINKPSNAVVGVPSEIDYDLLDANGIILDDNNSKVSVDFVDNKANGYDTTNADGKHTISVFEKGKSVTIQLVYHTSEYGTDGIEKTFKSNVFVVTGIDKKDTALADTKFTVTKDVYAKVGFDGTYTQNSQITLEDYGYSIQAYVKDSAGAEYKTSNTSDFKFESLDKTVVEVDANGKLYPITKGTAQIKVTVNANEKSFLVQVVVADKSKATQLSFDKSYAKVTAVDGIVSFNATLKDQYSNDVAHTFSASDCTALYGTENAVPYLTGDSKSIKFNATTAPVGKYTFRVTVGDVNREITVEVKPVGTATSALFVVSRPSGVDMARTNTNDDAEQVTFALYGVDKDGLKSSTYVLGTDYTISVENPKSVEVCSTGAFNVVTKSGSALTKVDPVGSYVVTVKAKVAFLNYKAGDIITKTAFYVSNSQIVPVVKKDNDSVNANADMSKVIAGIFSAKTTNKCTSIDIVAIKGYQVGTTPVADATITSVTSGMSYVVTKVVVRETYDNGNYFDHEITVNQQFKVN